jgi:acetyl esterase
MFASRFPENGLNDETASLAFLAASRSVKYPVSKPEKCPVGRLIETEIAPEVPIRIYVPQGEGPFPVMLYFHGGGWVAGELDQYDLTCRIFSKSANLVVINVGYRLAPEHPFPIPVDDCYSALKWAHENASTFWGDSDQLIVAGSSAGGNLAAAVALRARDEGPSLLMQVLIYPVTDSRMNYPSFGDDRNGTRYNITAKQMEWYWRLYTPNFDDRRNPAASPAHAESLAGLPFGIIAIAEYDPLCDEGQAYAERLEREGQGSELVRFLGELHGFMGMPQWFTSAEPSLELISSKILARINR